MSLRISSPDSRASCWVGSAAKASPSARHSSVCRNIASGSLAPTITRSGVPVCATDVGQLDVAGLRHRAGIERRDLSHVLVGGADEPGRVGGVRDQHAVAVDAVRGEPAAGSRRSPCRPRRPASASPPSTPDGEGHVARDAAAMDDQIVDEEAQRHLLQMVGQQLLGEPARETHQMVGRDRSGHRNGHEVSPFISLTRLDNRTEPHGPVDASADCANLPIVPG